MDSRTGVVLESLGGVYQIRLDDGSLVQASLRGRLKQEKRLGDRVVAGDRVEVLPAADEEERWTIESVLPRRSRLVRATARGHKARLVAANVDRMLVVLSVADPPFRGEIADAFLVLAEVCGLEPVLVLNKIDLPGGAEVVGEAECRFRGTGYRILGASAKSGEGIEALEALLGDGTSILAGPSGVGKSSLLNAIAPELSLRTGEVSRKLRRGRHTTVSARLLELPGGGDVVDTPGFSEVELWSVEPGELSDAFPEFRERADDCRFRGCSHTHEPDCVVKEALEAGEVDPARYQSYRRLRELLEG
jgi:ribosome biogenesis GTPase / thiamine phosphate phosphatase